MSKGFDFKTYSKAGNLDLEFFEKKFTKTLQGVKKHFSRCCIGIISIGHWLIDINLRIMM